MAAILAFLATGASTSAREPDLNTADEKGEDDMASVVERIALPVSPDPVLKQIGGFGSLPTGFPLFRVLNSMTAASAPFQRWRARNFPGRLMKFDQAKRSYTYELVEALVPVGAYL